MAKLKLDFARVRTPREKRGEAPETPLGLRGPQAEPEQERGGAPVSEPKAEPNYAPRGGSSQSGSSSSSGSASSNGSGSSSGSSGGYSGDFSAFYDKLAGKLRSYGVTGIPSYSELYSLFASFLRPSVDAAITARQKQGRTNAAELDADAYARGMGGSSYLTSMKAREQDAAASDIAALEGRYTASMAEYLYKAVSAMQQLESEMAKTRMQLAAQKQIAYAKLSAQERAAALKNSGKSGKSGRSSKEEETAHWGHNSKGAYFDGKWYEGDFSYLKKKYSYSDYAGYLNTLSAAERYLFFTSNSREWRIRRWQVQYNLAEVDYNDLYSAYMPKSGGARPGGGGVWTAMVS